MSTWSRRWTPPSQYEQYYAETKRLRLRPSDNDGASRRSDGSWNRYWRQVHVIEEIRYLTYGQDAANVLFHVVNDRHLRKRPMIFTTNKPLSEWGKPHSSVRSTRQQVTRFGISELLGHRAGLPHFAMPRSNGQGQEEVESEIPDPIG